MPQAIIYLGEEEDKIVKKLSKEWGLPQYETIAKIIREFKKEEINNNG